jgi:hypothetical protein
VVLRSERKGSLLEKLINEDSRRLLTKLIEY